MLPAKSLREIERELAKYPQDRRQSALPAALRIAQDEHGWLSAETIEFIAGVIGVPPVRAHEVATFYSMFELAPLGRHKISVCTNISCMLRGSARHHRRRQIHLARSRMPGRLRRRLTPERVDEILGGM